MDELIERLNELNLSDEAIVACCVASWDGTKFDTVFELVKYIETYIYGESSNVF